MAIVDIIIPTWNNVDQLFACLRSLRATSSAESLYHVFVVNNGDKDSLKELEAKPENWLTVLQPGSNLGWEGGLNYALKESTSPYVLLCNDDVHFLEADRYWLHKMLDFFRHDGVGAVGPASNFTAGSQNIFVQSQNIGFLSYPVHFLIGYCMLVRREALDKVGCIDESFHGGGDDIDLSIRLRQAGYSLICTRATFVYHHGFQSGVRKFGSEYNGIAMRERIDKQLIQKHGFAEWVKTLYMVPEQNSIKEYWDSFTAREQDVITPHIIGDVVYDLGCGADLTVPHAIGVDMVSAGEQVETLGGVAKSAATIVHNLNAPLPVKGETADTIIARHVLEHLMDTTAVLSDWHRVLKPKGTLIICVPDHEEHDSIPMNVEHVHAFTKESLRRFLMQAGFLVEIVEKTGNGISIYAVAHKKDE